MSKLIQRIIEDESGAALLEYTIIAVLTTAVCIGVILYTGVKLSSIYDLIDRDVSSAASK